MTAMVLLLLLPVLMWSTHRLLLHVVGASNSAGSAELPGKYRNFHRALTNLMLLGVIALYPLVRGVPIVDYYLGLLPFDHGLKEFLIGTAAAFVYLGGLYLAWLVSGNLHVRVYVKTSKALKRLMLLPFSALFGAMVEEMLFRGVLMADLLRSISAPWAVILTAFAFAAGHYIRPVKRYWTFAGHLALGVLLSVAFACTGNLWLPVGLHAAGIMLTLGLRPTVRSVGPPWLVGASIFPYAGIAGVIGLTALTLNIILRFRYP